MPHQTNYAEQKTGYINHYDNEAGHKHCDGHNFAM